MSPQLCVVVGDVINDVVVRPLEAVATGTDTPSLIEPSPGGSGANQAAWIAYLGGQVRFVGRAGAADAAMHRKALELLGVDARVTADTDRRTGTIVALVGPDGERSMFTDRGASATLGKSDFPEDLLAGASMLHVSAYQLFGSGAEPALSGLWASAIRRGLVASVDPASVAGLRRLGRERFFASTIGACLIFPNLDEGRFLAGKSRPDLVVSRLLEMYPTVVLKLGADGALAGSRAAGSLELPTDGYPKPTAGPPSRILDSTGAGDAFLGGFLAARLRAETPAEAARSREGLKRSELESATRAGLRAAAVAVHHLGARPPVPRSGPERTSGARPRAPRR